MNASEQRQLLADVEAFCEELRPIEELCYVEHRFNDQLISLGRKHNVLGMPVPVALGVSVLGEPLTPEIVAAFALILAGSVLATRSGLRRGAPPVVSRCATSRPG